MSFAEFVLSAVCVWLTILVIVLVVVCHGLQDRMKRLENDYRQFQEKREKFYDEMSKVAGSPGDFHEVNLTTARTTAPRENAGPPAKVYRPPLRAVPPTSWRPRNETSPRR